MFNSNIRLIHEIRNNFQDGPFCDAVGRIPALVPALFTRIICKLDVFQRGLVARVVAHALFHSQSDFSQTSNYFISTTHRIQSALSPSVPVFLHGYKASPKTFIHEPEIISMHQKYYNEILLDESLPYILPVVGLKFKNNFEIKRDQFSTWLPKFFGQNLFAF